MVRAVHACVYHLMASEEQLNAHGSILINISLASAAQYAQNQAEKSVSPSANIPSQLKSEFY